MLRSLHIKNYAIISDLTIDFDKGFNVFTGETGAGKSIIVGALSFLCKGRSDTSIIKNGADKAIIEGVFTIDNDQTKEQLKEQDIDFDDEIIVKRTISKDNHNTIKINESNVTLNFLTNLLSNYVDIHSQKDSQFLFHKENQLYLLDKYANTENNIKEYLSLYRNYKKILNEYDDLKNNVYSEREIEFYKYDFDELNSANLDLEEETKLEEMENRIKSSEKYLQVLNNSINLYSKDAGIKEYLYELINELNINDSKIKEIKENISNAYYSIDDAVNELKLIKKSFENDDLNIEQIEERLYTYSKLKRKHKTDTQGLIDLRNDLELKIQSFTDRDIVLNEKEKELNKAKQLAMDSALSISKLRKEKALLLEKQVIKETNDLLLNNVQFKIDIKEVPMNEKGIDDIEFLISLNKGEDLKPLKNVASGGEVSRLMLALKAAFSSISNTELLILDEIDTGVSGNVAMSIGEKIAKLAKNSQVLCITHLSPVAACANSHFYIYKSDDDKSTTTNVKKLNKEEIINELATISNTNANSKAIEAAKELYKTAQAKVKEL